MRLTLRVVADSGRIGPLPSGREVGIIPTFSALWKVRLALKDHAVAPFRWGVSFLRAGGRARGAAGFLGPLFVITAFGSLAGATTGAANADAGVASTDGSVTAPVISGGTASGSQPPTWRDDKITLTLDPTFMALPNARVALQAAVTAFTSVASELPAVEIVESQVLGTSLLKESGASDHRISFAVDGEPLAKGALAITLVAVSQDGNAIVDGDIIVNGEHHFRDAAEYAGGWANSRVSYYDLQNVLTHELGHWFGLGEEYVDTESTMYAYVNPGETKKRDLTLDDATAVQLAYWRADNPSENLACSMSYGGARPKGGLPGLAIGLLAVSLFWLRRSNRRGLTHLSMRPRRLVIQGNSKESTKKSTPESR